MTDAQHDPWPPVREMDEPPPYSIAANGQGYPAAAVTPWAAPAPPPLRYDPTSNQWVAADPASDDQPPALPTPSDPDWSFSPPDPAFELSAPLPNLVPGHARTLNTHSRAPLSLTGEDPEWDALVQPIEPADSLATANVITSQVAGAPGMHKVAIDIDLPAVLIPSTTPGHYHLYIDQIMSWEVYTRLLDALAIAGVIEFGYARASKIRGCTSLRLPWIKKDPSEKGTSG
jgi:hypothetical protein